MTTAAEEIERRRRTSDDDRRLGGNIFSVSAGLVGVCLTVIGLFRVIVPGSSDTSRSTMSRT